MGLNIVMASVGKLYWHREANASLYGYRTEWTLGECLWCGAFITPTQNFVILCLNHTDVTTKFY